MGLQVPLQLWAHLCSGGQVLGEKVWASFSLVGKKRFLVSVLVKCDGS